jgi:hypothetical protein
MKSFCLVALFVCLSMLGIWCFWYIDCAGAKSLKLFAHYSYTAALVAGDVNGLRLDFYRALSDGGFETESCVSLVVIGTSALGPAIALFASEAAFSVQDVSRLRFTIANISTNATATQITVTAQTGN